MPAALTRIPASLLAPEAIIGQHLVFRLRWPSPCVPSFWLVFWSGPRVHQLLRQTRAALATPSTMHTRSDREASPHRQHPPESAYRVLAAATRNNALRDSRTSAVCTQKSARTKRSASMQMQSYHHLELAIQQARLCVVTESRPMMTASAR